MLIHPALRANKARFLDGNIEQLEEYARTYELVSLKYDGCWAFVAVPEEDNPTLFFISRTGKVLAARKALHCEANLLPGFAYEGELMVKQQWAKAHYPDGRFIVRQCLGRSLPGFCQSTEGLYADPLTFEQYYDQWGGGGDSCVTYRSASAALDLWDTWVIENGWEGVVFRNMNQTNDFVRVKRECEVEGVAIGFELGQGKYAGLLGALNVVLDNGKHVQVGGGFSDEERSKILLSWNTYMGRRCVIKGKGLFDSGLPRHPVFKEWRNELS